MGDLWEEGRRAWERLDGWDAVQDFAGSPARSGEAALRALADIGTARRLLDQAELGAVKSARAEKKSWAEIATRLGVTRQSAWERWRDLDEPATAHPDRNPPGPPVTGRSPRADQRRGQQYPAEVPNVVGLSLESALRMLELRMLVAIGVDPDGIPTTPPEELDSAVADPNGEFLGTTELPDGVVTDQSPEAGAVVSAGSVVTLWIGRGGGSAGDREPRRPLPTSLPAAKARVARELKYSSPAQLDPE